MNSSSTHILTMKCRDQIGLVAAVSGFLADRDCNITRSSQFEDAESGNFFMRTSFDAGEGTMDTDLAPMAEFYRRIKNGRVSLIRPAK